SFATTSDAMRESRKTRASSRQATRLGRITRRPDLGSVAATSNTYHPERSRSALLLFCFAPAKQPACAVEGSLFIEFWIDYFQSGDRCKDFLQAETHSPSP